MADLSALKNSKDALSRVIRDTKTKLRALNPNYATAFRAMEDDIRREVDAVVGKRERGDSIVPEIAYADIAAGRVSDAPSRAIRRTGAAVVRGVFPRPQAEAWNEEIGDYLAPTTITSSKVDPSRDKYFTTLKSDRPQIFGIYWSKPQMEARQVPSAGRARAFLNRPVDARERRPALVRPGPRMHLRRPHPPARARRRQPRPVAAHGRRLGGALDRRRPISDVYRQVFAGDWRPLRSLRRRLAAPTRRRSHRQPCAACSAPIRAGRR